MEELYEKYSMINSKKVNNVINKNLTFKFNGHYINFKCEHLLLYKKIIINYKIIYF